VFGLRLLGAMAVVLAAAGLGRLWGGRFEARVEQLDRLIGSLQLLASEIDYTLTPLPEALLRVGQADDGPVGAIFRRVARELGALREPFNETWRRVLREAAGGVALERRDLEIVGELGFALGASDRQDQLKHLALAGERLRQMLNEARRRAEKNGPLGRSLGVLGGLMLALILL